MHPDAITETYLEVERLVRSVLFKFIAKYGGDELDYGIHEAFLKAYNEFDSDLGKKFTDHVSWMVWYGLLDQCKRKQIPIVDIDPDLFSRPASFSFPEFLEVLTDDAQLIVSLVSNPPRDLYQEIERRGGRPHNIRTSIYQWLRKQGWTHKRIKDSFVEIRLALN